MERRHIIALVILAASLLSVVALIAFSGTSDTAAGPDSTSSTIETQDAAPPGNNGSDGGASERISFVWWGPNGSLSVDDESSEAPTYRYVIPLGTWDSIEAGEEVDIVPAELEVRVGETIEIVNEDNQIHFIGPFTVVQGESLRQRFSEPGESLGTCSAHVLGSVKVVVTEA